MKPSEELLHFLEENPLPWLWYSEEKQKLIMVVDNHLMSTYRACPQHFINAHVLGLRRKSEFKEGTVDRNWYLEFGILLHRALEIYYKNFQNPNFDNVAFCTQSGVALWNAAEMDIFTEHKEYKLIGGVHGFVGLLIQYSTLFNARVEKLRIIGTEVAFGKNLEVPLWSDCFQEFYLAGRMDLIVDDGYFICPMDHKTMGSFRGEPALRFATDEGPTGYIFALKTILPQFLGENEILKRDCSKILMNLISKTPTTTPQERFLRVPLRKTVEQLELYRERMITTCQHLLTDMEHVAAGWPVWRNTQVCQNWMHLPCAYFDLCRQGSQELVQMTIKNGFTKTPLWDTEAVEAAS